MVDVSEILEGSAWIAFYCQNFHRNEVFRLRYQHRHTARSWSCLRLSEDLLAGRTSDVEEIDPSTVWVRVQVVGIGQRTVEGLESRPFHKGYELLLGIKVDDQVEIQG